MNSHQLKKKVTESGGVRPYRLLRFCSFLLFFFSGVLSGQQTPGTYPKAYDAGYAQGQQAGQQDKQDDHLFDFANKKLFQQADQGFDPSHHDHEVYFVAYRRGFKDGYEQGYGLIPQAAVYRRARLRTRVGNKSFARYSRRRAKFAPSSRTNTPASVRPRRTPNWPAAEILNTPIPTGTEIRVKLLDALSTQRNVRGDPFRGEVLKDVRMGQKTVIPRGTLVLGTIAYLKRAGRIAGRTEMNLRFEELQFSNGTSLPIVATLERIEERPREKVQNRTGTIKSESGKSEDTKAVGTSSAIGALVGLITGGKKGAGLGATAGAAVRAAGVLAARGHEIKLYPETELVVKLNKEAVFPSATPPALPAAFDSNR